MVDFLVYDVFTDTPFGGNPLAVVTDGPAVPEAQLQKIAREFNFSETTFVYPPVDPTHTAKVRIFTPTMEIPFAGHPIIGTALALHDLGRAADMVLELGVGPIACSITKGLARFTATQPLTIDAHPDLADVAACLGVAPGAIRTDRHMPVLAGVGLPFVLAELSDLAALNSVQPVSDAFRAGAAQYPSQLDFAIYAYVRDGAAVSARMFAPLDNIPEDPATGSAAAALAAFLSQLESAPLTLLITQGQDMGRPSHIQAEVELEGGLTRAIHISGRARKMMVGRLTL
ncbi:PhzF family phenazine biosynthesis protein [Oceaniglobus ichthyenteri]|uniref:PhzF family phenazine biosynthesis protein n=1 Tax=Oceaniglobus ichthyenteri TaxID=2136177 RepID=UPI000D3AC2A1|nr:PhzF family phenazine biosynthesis protein [Oceaniglobus ichthyenteri]